MPTLLDWDAPGPYRVAFSTRLGGVSEGPFESLNLGVLTGDEPKRVLENRRRLFAAVGADPDWAAMARQVHGERVVEANGGGVVTPGAMLERCDGLWSDRPGLAMLLLTADCFPVALARRDGGVRLAVLHVGWRGLLAGIAAAGMRSLAGGTVAAAIGPGIGPCCYEVGSDVRRRFATSFGDEVIMGRNLDLAQATEKALRAAGCDWVERTAICTACEADLFFSHRRDGGVTGRQGVVAYVV
ncbi:MAG: polyphenol oxidase family protein [Actinomycetota bacterium]|nr:polyphenol oxidase family protein [Actinomycetota bacterium]